jgi:hypothetical protein
MCWTQEHTSQNFRLSVEPFQTFCIAASDMQTHWSRSQSQSQSHSYFTTSGLPPNSFSWRQAPWESRPVILFCSWTLAIIFLMQLPLWREEWSVVYNCCWSSETQSFSGPSPAGLMTIFYCLSFETPQTGGPVPRIYIPQKQGGPVILPSTGFSFRRLLRLASTRDSRYTTDHSSSTQYLTHKRHELNST